MRIALVALLCTITAVAHAHETDRRCFQLTDAKEVIEACTAWLADARKLSGSPLEYRLADALEHRANAYTDLRKYDEAIDDLNQATKKGTTGSINALVLLGSLYIVRVVRIVHGPEPGNPNDLARGIVILTKVLERGPNGAAHSLRGLAFSYMGAHDLAKVEHVRAVEMLKVAMALNNQAYSCYLEFRLVSPGGVRGPMESCLTLATSAIQLEAIAEALHTRGLIYEALGRPKDAREDFRKSLQIDPLYTVSASSLRRLDTPSAVVSAPSKKKQGEKKRRN